MRRDLHSRLEKLENAVLSNEDDDDVQFYEFTDAAKVPILTDAQAQERGLTQCVTLDEIVRYELDPHYKLEGQYITPELMAFIAESASEAEAEFKDDPEYQQALEELYTALARASARERRQLIAEFHKRYSRPPRPTLEEL